MTKKEYVRMFFVRDLPNGEHLQVKIAYPRYELTFKEFMTQLEAGIYEFILTEDRKKELFPND